MLKSLFVDNFRLFKQLQIEEFGRANLIVGENNSGKSALLEAIQVYASNASPNKLIDLVVSRQESWEKEAQSLEKRVQSNPLRHLFYGHELPEISEKGFRIGESEDSESLVHLKLGAYRSERQEDGSLVRNRVEDISEEEDLSDVDLSLISETRDKTRRLLDLDEDLRNPRFRRRLSSRVGIDPNYPLQVVPTGDIASSRIASLWDTTSLTDLENDVISCMKLIDSRIERIAFVEDDTSRYQGDRRIPLIKVDGVEEPLPLKSMGDGMSRIFHIVLSLVNAQDGILLIDEFENGIHWSIHPKLWESVFSISEKLNVQVFATTHSRDCIEGFDSAWNRDTNSGSFIRLNLDNYSHSGVTLYNSETLTDALEMNVEVR